VLGARGAGLLEQAGLDQQQVPLLMATLGKAAGTAGAFVAASETLIETLIQQARPYIFTTASPPALVAATLKAIDIIENESWRRDKLGENIACFRELADADGLTLMPSKTAIQPLLIGDNHKTLALADALFGAGLTRPLEELTGPRAWDTDRAGAYMDRASDWMASQADSDMPPPQVQPDYESYSQEQATYQVGMRIRHDNFGTGVVRKVEGSGEQTRVTVIFDYGGERKFLAQYAPMAPTQS